MPTYTTKHIPKYIREFRKEHELSILDFAEKSGLSYSSISKLENGDMANPTFRVLYILSKTLGIPLENLLT